MVPIFSKLTSFINPEIGEVGLACPAIVTDELNARLTIEHRLLGPPNSRLLKLKDFVSHHFHPFLYV